MRQTILMYCARYKRKIVPLICTHVASHPRTIIYPLSIPIPLSCLLGEPEANKCVFVVSSLLFRSVLPTAFIELERVQSQSYFIILFLPGKIIKVF